MYWSNLIFKIIKYKKEGDNMSAFENIIISIIKYLNKMLIIYHKIIINYSQIKVMNFYKL